MTVAVALGYARRVRTGCLLELRDERSRSLTAENPDGAAGSGGQAASRLGPGRKGSPNVPISAGETRTTADVDEPGIIDHIWVTAPNESHGRSVLIRDFSPRMYWDGEDDPSVEVPLGDFFGCGHGRYCDLSSVPMPFRESAEITVESDGPEGGLRRFDPPAGLGSHGGYTRTPDDNTRHPYRPRAPRPPSAGDGLNYSLNNGRDRDCAGARAFGCDDYRTGPAPRQRSTLRQRV